MTTRKEDNKKVTNVKVGEINIRVDEDVAAGEYANLAMVNHTPDEFVVDFIFVEPGIPKGSVRSRVVLTPGHFKRLLGAMNANLQRYEQAFGEIPDRQAQTTVPQDTGPVN